MCINMLLYIAIKRIRNEGSFKCVKKTNYLLALPECFLWIDSKFKTHDNMI